MKYLLLYTYEVYRGGVSQRTNLRHLLNVTYYTKELKSVQVNNAEKCYF